MDQAKLLNEMTESLDSLFSQFDVEVGNWPMLALKLAIDGGHLKPPAPRGAPPLTPKDHVLTWARVQKALDDGPKKPNGEPKLTQKRALYLAGVSRTALHTARKCEVTSHFAEIHARFGSEAFWKCFSNERWQDSCGNLTPAERRLIAKGGNTVKTLLGGADPI